VAVSKQRWWGLLVLAAVFAMHGVQCTDHDLASSGYTATVGVHAGASLAGDGPPPHGASDQLIQASVVDGHAVSVLAHGPAAAQHGDHPAASLGHLWAVCLAVLSAGLAVLVALLVRRRGIGAPPDRWQRLPRRPGLSTVPRPPDIYSLCVLRT
jgi:hypothetical protein